MKIKLIVPLLLAFGLFAFLAIGSAAMFNQITMFRARMRVAPFDPAPVTEVIKHWYSVSNGKNSHYFLIWMKTRHGYCAMSVERRWIIEGDANDCATTLQKALQEEKRWSSRNMQQ